MDYNLLILAHLASVVLLLGVGGGSAYYKFMADRTRDVEIIVHTNKMVVLADWLFTTPSVILQPVTGIILINGLNIKWQNESWLSLSIALYIFSVLLWLVAVYLQIKMKNLAIEAKQNNALLDDNYYKLVWYWVLLGIFSFLAMGSIFYLMVYKPIF